VVDEIDYQRLGDEFFYDQELFEQINALAVGKSPAAYRVANDLNDLFD
jgi:hypothetical protein